MDFRIRHTWFKPQFQPNCTMLDKLLKYSDFSTWKVGIQTFIKSVLNDSYVLLRVLGLLLGMTGETEHTDEELRQRAKCCDR